MIEGFSRAALEIIQDASNEHEASLLLRLNGYGITPHPNYYTLVHRGPIVVLKISPSMARYRRSSPGTVHPWRSCHYEMIRQVLDDPSS